MPEEVKPTSPGDVASGQVPIWMDAPFFQKALREGGDDPKIRIVECDVKEALGKGENYVSIVYRALVKDQTGKEHHLIVKCLPSNEARKSFANKGNLFRKEIDMYNIVFPAYQKLQPKADNSLLWPKHYFSFFNGDCDYLVMEDLKKAGFVMRERRKGLDRNHVEAALSALARYHAHSYVLKLKEPENFKKLMDLYPETLYSENLKEMFGIFLRDTHENISDTVKDWGGQRYEKIASKIRQWKDTAFDDTFRLLAPVEPGALLTHGDFWVNNILFKYSDPKEAETGSGKPVEVKLLDFQIARYSSLATDLMYVMVSSMDGKTRREHWNDLLESAYLRSFWGTLECYGVQDKVQKGIFTIDWLRDEIHRMLPFAFISALTITPAVLAESDDAPDMDSLTEDELNGTEPNPFAYLQKRKAFIERFKGLIDDFDEQGLFD